MEINSKWKPVVNSHLSATKGSKTKSIVLLFSIFSTLLLSSCSSDPFRNAGECNKPGSYKKIDGELAICAGLDSKFKYYFEGKPFEDMYLLGKAELDSLTFENEDPFLNEAKLRGLSDLTWRTDHNITNDELSAYASGDSRWDPLIEANTRRLALESENKEAQNYRFSMLNDWRAGKVSREIAYQAQQDQMAVFKKLESAQTVFDEKLAVLRAEIKRLYGISNTVDVMLFVVVAQHK